MVSVSEQDLLWASFRDSPELIELSKLILATGAQISPVSKSYSVHIAQAIAAGDKTEFEATLKRIEALRLTPEATWLSDDALIFLLLVGLLKFSLTFSKMGEILTLRERAADEFSQLVNQAYRDIYISNLSIDLQSGFIKAVARDISGKGGLDREEVPAVRHSYTVNGRLHAFRPFFKLLVIRADALALEAADNEKVETTSTLIKKLRDRYNDFSAKDYWRLVTALPIRIWLALIVLIVAVAVFLLKFPTAYNLVSKRFFSARPLEFHVTTINGELPKQIIGYFQGISPVSSDIYFVDVELPASDSGLELIASTQVSIISEALLIKTERATKSVTIAPGIRTDNGFVWNLDSLKGPVSILLRGNSNTDFLKDPPPLRISVK
jgi:hypothetical protein